jgi:hypothetical protein
VGKTKLQGPGFDAFKQYTKPPLLSTYFDSNELLLSGDINTLLRKESLLESIYVLRVGYKQKKRYPFGIPLIFLVVVVVSA